MKCFRQPLLSGLIYRNDRVVHILIFSPTYKMVPKFYLRRNEVIDKQHARRRGLDILFLYAFYFENHLFSMSIYSNYPQSCICSKFVIVMPTQNTKCVYRQMWIYNNGRCTLKIWGQGFGKRMLFAWLNLYLKKNR